MLAVTHLFIALLLIRAFKLDRQEAFATLLFGVLIDLDHLFGMVDFVAREGWQNALNINAALTSDVQWKSLLHSPEGALFVGAITLSYRMFAPLLAWGLHVIMDHVQIYYLGIASPLEILLLAALTVILVLCERRDHKELTGDASLSGLGRWEVERFSRTIFSLPLIRSLKRSRGPQGTSG